MERSVGLIVMIQIPDESASGYHLAAVLQRRGTYSTERMAPAYFPGCLQVTCHGKLEEGEDPIPGLLRELEEELGPTFIPGALREVTFTSTEKKEVTTFATFVPARMIRNIRLGPDSGGLEVILKAAVEDIVEITPAFKVKGPEFRHTLAMFEDEIRSLKTAFEILG